MPRTWVYRIGVIVIFLAVFQSPVSYLIFGKIEKGIVTEIVFEYSGITILPYSSYPRIEFTYQNKTYSILGEENENLLVGENVKVIFFKNNPSKAKVLNFWGLFIDTIIQLPIGLLIWWALFKSFPNLFDSTMSNKEYASLLIRGKAKKRERISEAPINTRIVIYVLVLIISICLLYGLWDIYQELISGKMSYQIGIGISILIIVILSTMLHKVLKG
jgi:hypothetical protein